MSIIDYVVVGGIFSGKWEESPKCWVWKTASKDTVSIALHRNDSYPDMVKSVMESSELSCDQSEVLISYLMNGRGKIHPTFIRNDRHVELYMLCFDSDNSKPILRVKVFERSRKEASTSAPPSPPPLPPNVDDTSMEYDFMGCDEWDNSEDYEEEECGGGVDKMSFNYTTLKSSNKYLRVRCVDLTWRWMMRACAIGESGWFHVHKYVGEHTCGIDHVMGKHKNVIVEAELLKVLDGRRHCEEHSLRYFRAWICIASRIFIYFQRSQPRSINSLRVDESLAGLFTTLWCLGLPSVDMHT
ncbi:hypothetical protein P3S67_006324 [Capsicum chacoense]